MGTLNNMDNQDTVTVEWPNFGQALGHDMWEFFMSKQYSDITICTEEGHEIPSHRIVLAMCSPYFRDLFKSKEAANPIGELFFNFMQNKSKRRGYVRIHKPKITCID